MAQRAATSAPHPEERSINELSKLPTSELITYLLNRYHHVHREQLRELCQLAKKVEEFYVLHPDCPTGLSDHLEDMKLDLERHMQKEEQILFPMFEQGMFGMAQGPISVMRHEHDSHGEDLKLINMLTKQISLPEDAGQSWQELYTGLKEFISDLQQHIKIENDILFTRS